MWVSGADLRLVMEVVYPHFDAFKLLLCKSAGTRYVNFLHELVLLEQKETAAYMEAARARGVPVKEVLPEELHLLMSAYITALFEVVVHDFPQEEAGTTLPPSRPFSARAGGRSWGCEPQPPLFCGASQLYLTQNRTEQYAIR